MADIFKLLDRPIAYHRIFAEIAGSVTGGVMLSQAVYWSRRSSTGDGWFYKNREEWEEETFLTRWEQESARTALRRLGVWEEERRGMPRRLFYRINFDKLTVMLLAEKPPSSWRKNLRQDGGKTSDKTEEKPPTYIGTEITTENTTDIFLSSASPIDQKNKKKRVVSISEFQADYLNESLRAWAADIAPGVTIETATEGWIEYHEDADSHFRNRGAILSSWKGWIRNAQKIITQQKNQAITIATTIATKKGKGPNEREPDYESIRAAGLL